MDNNEGTPVDAILQSSSDSEEDYGWNTYDCGDAYCRYCGIDADDDSHCSEEEEMNDEEEMNEEVLLLPVTTPPPLPMTRCG
nr:ORF3 [Ostreid herpesvirus 1]